MGFLGKALGGASLGLGKGVAGGALGALGGGSSGGGGGANVCPCCGRSLSGGTSGGQSTNQSWVPSGQTPMMGISPVLRNLLGGQ